MAASTTNEDALELEPPENFAFVCKGVFRSAFPKKKNFKFLEKLKLKSILYTKFLRHPFLHSVHTHSPIKYRTLILEEYPEQNMIFCRENDIMLFQYGVPGNKEPFVDIPDDQIAGALAVLMGAYSLIQHNAH